MPSPAATARSIATSEGFTGPDPTGAALRWVWLIAAYIAVVGLGYLSGSTAVRIAAAVFGGLLLFGIVIGGHEAVHGTLSSRRWVNTVAGTLSMVTVGLPYETYRRLHLEHHAWINTDRDPEGNYRYGGIVSFVALSAFFGAGFVVVLWSNTVLGVVGRSPYVRTVAQRRRLGRVGLVSFAILALLIAAAVVEPAMRWLWLAPALAAVFVWAPIILTPEHYGLVDGEIPHTTRTTFSNPVMRAITWNLGLHTAHHLQPSVAASRLPAFHRRIGPSARPETTSGYLAFQWRILRSLLPGRTDFVPVDDARRPEVVIDLTAPSAGSGTTPDPATPAPSPTEVRER